METDKDHIHLLIKSEPKISVLSIIRRLKQESTNRLWKTEKEYLKKHYWEKTHYGVMDILYPPLEMLVRKQ